MNTLLGSIKLREGSMSRGEIRTLSELERDIYKAVQREKLDVLRR